jgi:lipopolysaccharide transport system ATP-binding protein
MSEPIISVERLGKRYRIAHQGGRRGSLTLREVIRHKLAAPFRALNGKDPNSQTNGQSSDLHAATSRTEDFWALKNVSFEIQQGEVVGVIGRNGAGKSTLLKILSRITEPTEGRIRIRGRVSSLLEVGTGFHQELTGRENVFLNGAILGMHRAEIKQKFDEIVAFAEVEKFLDTPVKHYSSGMYVRLAFAVAAHLEPEILIVDEVLAVGDVDFQKKCLGKIRTVSESGRTVLFVSHNTGVVANLCSKVLCLKRGQVDDFGPVMTTLAKYLADSEKVGSDADIDSHRIIKPTNVRMNTISISGKNESRLYWGEPIGLMIEVETKGKIEGLSFGVTVTNQRGEAVGSCLFPDRFGLKAGEKTHFSLAIAGEDLTPGIYTFSVGLGRGQQELLDAVTGYPTFEILPTSESGKGIEVWYPSWGSISFKKIQFERIYR